MKKLLVLGLSVLFLIGCSKESSEAPQISSSESESTMLESLDQGKIDIIINSLNEGFGGITNISFNEESKTFHMSPIPGLKETEALKIIAENPEDETVQSTLKQMASSAIELSSLITENLGEGYSIQLDGLENDPVPFYVIKDSTIEYPVLNKW